MSSSTTKKSKDFSTGVFGLKAAIIIVGFILLVAVLSLLYLSTWTIVAKHRYALLTSAFIYPTSTYILLLCSLFTSISIIGLFFMAWVEHRRGLNIVKEKNEIKRIWTILSLDFDHSYFNVHFGNFCWTFSFWLHDERKFFDWIQRDKIVFDFV